MAIEVKPPTLDDDMCGRHHPNDRSISP